MGLERSIAGKHAGMRTYALVALGACLFTTLGFGTGVVIGIGFIGAGLAAVRGGTHVELTTAAGVWVAAAVGMAVAGGFYLLAAGVVVLSVCVLSLLLPLESRIRARYGQNGEQ